MSAQQGTTRPLHIAALALAVIAGMGFLLGVRRDPYGTLALSQAQQRPSTERAQPARSYRELMVAPWDKNEALRDDAARRSAAQHAAAKAPQAPATEEQLALTRAQRLRRRAFEGAPPSVPHPIEQQGDQACISCHNLGLAIKDRVARPMSHEYLTNCIQCHAAVDEPQPFPEDNHAALPLDSTFVGRTGRRGVRALIDAPPAIPHQTWMRERCASCHGPQGWEGIRTTHPERTNCMQCHAPSAIDDQQPAAWSP
jgi:cytochrome c-type protein NapB